MNGMATASRASRSATLVWVSAPGFSRMKSTWPAACWIRSTRAASELVWKVSSWCPAAVAAAAGRLLDIGEGRGAIKMGFPPAEQVQVGAVEQQEPRHRLGTGSPEMAASLQNLAAEGY